MHCQIWRYPGHRLVPAGGRYDCRGLSQEAAEGLFATATLEETALAVEDETVRAGVGRLAGRLGIPYQEVED